MENDPYFNLEVMHFHTEEVFHLNHRMSMKGCGIYVHLLCYLRTCDGFRGCCDEAVLEVLARQYGVEPKEVASVIQDFGLFEREEDGAHFRSPYLDKVMACLVKKRAVMKPVSAAVPAAKTTTVDGGKTTVRAVTVKRLADGRFTGKKTAVRNSREEKSKEEKSREENSSDSNARETAAVTVADLPPVLIDSSPVRAGGPSDGEGAIGWRRWMDEMVTDRSWMEPMKRPHPIPLDASPRQYVPMGRQRRAALSVAPVQMPRSTSPPRPQAPMQMAVCTGAEMKNNQKYLASFLSG